MFGLAVFGLAGLYCSRQYFNDYEKRRVTRLHGSATPVRRPFNMTARLSTCTKEKRRAVIRFLFVEGVIPVLELATPSITIPEATTTLSDCRRRTARSFVVP
ncbi:hypothetical protein TNCV_1804391 [Trichonephila clavipes]|nr:hypothetical protein TNCV_1804391 [Trichonephila clavipes]